MTTPRYTNHCTNCVFLGRLHRLDLYFCRHHRTNRRGSFRRKTPCIFIKGSERTSSVLGRETWHWHGDPIVAALRLACRAGLIDKTDAETALAGVPLS